MAQHSAKGAQLQVITANRLRDGEVVYFSAPTTWVVDLKDASIADGADALEGLLAQANTAPCATDVLDIYPFEVAKDTSGALAPASVRETIRAAGPTVRTDLGKQTELR
jgi:hypothetical protein